MGTFTMCCPECDGAAELRAEEMRSIVVITILCDKCGAWETTVPLVNFDRIMW